MEVDRQPLVLRKEIGGVISAKQTAVAIVS